MNNRIAPLTAAQKAEAYRERDAERANWWQLFAELRSWDKVAGVQIICALCGCLRTSAMQFIAHLGQKHGRNYFNGQSGPTMAEREKAK